MSPMLGALAALLSAPRARAANESCFEEVQLLQQLKHAGPIMTPHYDCSTNSGYWCQFPFEYNGKTYSECTKDGASSGRMWCGIEQQGWFGSTWDYCDDICYTAACLTTSNTETHRKALCSILEEDECLSQGGAYNQGTHDCDLAFDVWRQKGTPDVGEVACITFSYGAYMQKIGATCRKVPQSECTAGDDFFVGGEMDVYPGMDCDEALKIHNGHIGTTIACITDHGYQYRAECSMVGENSCVGAGYPGFDCQEALALHDGYRQQAACVNYNVRNEYAVGTSCIQVRDEYQCHNALDLGMGTHRTAYHGWTCDDALSNFYEWSH